MIFVYKIERHDEATEKYVTDVLYFMMNRTKNTRYFDTAKFSFQIFSVINSQNIFLSTMERKTILSRQTTRLPMRCHVCGDIARGLNFNLITCMSCKTFFRRNVYRRMVNLSSY